MKLDYELIRNLLLTIECESDGFENFTFPHYARAFSDYPAKTVAYHIKYLLDAGYVEGEYHRYISDITPIGRDYLNSIRDPGIWEKVKARIHPLGSVALDIVSDVGKSFICEQLGL